LASRRCLSEADYFVRIFYVCTASPDINAARVARRVMEGGHDVPITKIIPLSRLVGERCAMR
jgi:predicted ABC-type ATPase